MTGTRVTALLGALVLAAVAAACSGDSTAPVACTLEARPSLRVEVVDSASGTRIPGPTVRVRDGTFTDTLAVHDGVAAGPFERPGTYDVRVEENGFAPWVRRGVNVTEGRCHVETRELTARLQPSE